MVTRVRESGGPKPGVARRGLGLGLDILTPISAQSSPSAELKGATVSVRTTEDVRHVGPPLHAAQQRSSRIKLRRAVTFMGMTLLLPGSAQMAAGNKRVGRIALRIWTALIAVVITIGILAQLCGGRLHLRSRPAGSSDRIDHRWHRLGPAAYRCLAHLRASRARSHAQDVAYRGERGSDHGRHRWTARLRVGVVRAAQPGERSLHRR